MTVEGVPFEICDLCENTAGTHRDPHLGLLCTECRTATKRATRALHETPGIAAYPLTPSTPRNHRNQNQQ